MTAAHRVRRKTLKGVAVALGLVSAVSLATAQGGPPAELMPSPQTPAPTGADPATSGPDTSGPKTSGPKTSGPKTPLPAPTPRAALPNQSRQAANPDWPCVQPRVAELSYGQIWSGPALGEALQTWQSDPAVADLVPILVARRTTKEAADAALDKFAKDAGADKNAKLALLFAGIFQEINASRSAIITGIERYAVKQRALSDKIKQSSLQLAADKKGKDMAALNAPEFRTKEDALTWDTRIYDERSHSLTYVCETPVILDQLAFDRARDIQARMD